MKVEEAFDKRYPIDSPNLFVGNMYDIFKTGFEEGEKNENDAFIRGAACAIASIIHTHGIDTGLREAFDACIGTYQNCIDAQCDKFDLEILKQHFK